MADSIASTAASVSPASQARRAWPSLASLLRAHGPAAAVGLALGLLALGPGLARGFLLSYDMVFVPDPPFSSALLGLSGGPARAVPSDAAITVAARVLPADITPEAHPPADLHRGLHGCGCVAFGGLASLARPPCAATGLSGQRDLLRLESVRGRATPHRPVGAAARLRRAAVGVARGVHRTSPDQAGPACAGHAPCCHRRLRGAHSDRHRYRARFAGAWQRCSALPSARGSNRRAWRCSACRG